MRSMILALAGVGGLLLAADASAEDYTIVAGSLTDAASGESQPRFVVYCTTQDTGSSSCGCMSHTRHQGRVRPLVEAAAMIVRVTSHLYREISTKSKT